MLVSDLHRLRELRRRTGTPSVPASLASQGSLIPMSAQEVHHAVGTEGHPSRGRFVTFPSEAPADARLADEWRAVLGQGGVGRGAGAPKQRVLKSECLRVRPAFSSECLRSRAAATAAAAASPVRARSDSDIVSLHSATSTRMHSQVLRSWCAVEVRRGGA